MTDSKTEYLHTRKEYSIVLGEAWRLGTVMSGMTGLSSRHWHGAQMFKKLAAHSQTLATITPSDRPGQEFWDYSSMCAITRCLIEAFYAFQYLGASTVSEDDWRERKALYDYHGYLRKVQSAQEMGFETPERLKTSLDRARDEMSRVCTQRGYSAREISDRLKKPQAFLVSDSKQGEALGLQAAWVRTMRDYLSWFVHSLPASIHELAYFEAASSSAYDSVKILLITASGYLGRANADFVELFPQFKAGAIDGSREVGLFFWEGLRGLGPDALQMPPTPRA